MDYMKNERERGGRDTCGWFVDNLIDEIRVIKFYDVDKKLNE